MMSHKAIYRNKKSVELFAIETDEKGAGFSNMFFVVDNL
jgi:hypothetical protein